MSKDLRAKAKALTLDRLMQLRDPEGHWEGKLSSSALSTAVAISALALASPHHQKLIQDGVRWLAKTQNKDGGFGDTDRSKSNISTTLLVLATLHITKSHETHADTAKGIRNWLGTKYGTTPSEWAEAVRKRYGKDKTFSVPILNTLAIAGLVSWEEVPFLPFELAALPQSWYRFAQMPVVSYALPALIAIGLCIQKNRASWNPLTIGLRALCRGRVLSVLETIQPSHGGFLEATPLTAFVTMSLCMSGEANSLVVKRGVLFLVKSVLVDGSWPIDTNLSTWVTSLAVHALAKSGELSKLSGREKLKSWYLVQQYQARHPYTDAPPGGWAWTPLPGGVPDADDTPGAMIALQELGQPDGPWRRLATDWLLGLQNRDGGIPTFCRGWGKLPFDRSGTDLTAHSLRALYAWEKADPRIGPMRKRALSYLAGQQQKDGSWLPLWFGHQDEPNENNPVLGTARVLAAYRDLDLMDGDQAKRGVAFLQEAQNPDGGWGGHKGIDSQIEETGLVLEALNGLKFSHDLRINDLRINGQNWLARAILSGGLQESAPIGFYFAKLWYYETMYPVVFALGAMGPETDPCSAPF